MNKYIPVAFCFDANYAPYAAVSTFSLAKNSSSPLKIYWVTLLEFLDNAKFLQEGLKKFDIEVTIISINFDHFKEWKEVKQITKAAYLRLLLPNIIDEKKLIYLDCDVLVLSDLLELYEEDMGEFSIGGIYDSVGGATSRVSRDSNDIYINSGVLLMNLEVLRRDDFKNKCEVIYDVHQDNITWLDQCIINKYAENKKLIVDEKWNKQIFPNSTNHTSWQQIISSGNARIIHFVGPIKPWCQWCNPVIADFWWKYANQLSLTNLAPIPITHMHQAMDYSSVLDLCEQYQSASDYKGKIIKLLLDEQKKNKFEMLTTNAERFSYIYKENLWGSSDNPSRPFFSGDGSSNALVVNTYVGAISLFINSLDFKPSVIDLGCGDFYIGSRIRGIFDKYIACDIVQPLIEFNEKKFSSLNVDFRVLDIVSDQLPSSDIVIIRQVFQHLSNSQIQAVLGKINHNFDYLIVTEERLYNDRIEKNIDIKPSFKTRHIVNSDVRISEQPFNFKSISEKVLCSIPVTQISSLTTTLYKLR
jgi:lipopolysaccharide biosynthesis glycosyltransferase